MPSNTVLSEGVGEYGPKRSIIEDRFEALEAKMKVVDMMYSLHESTKDAKGFSPNSRENEYWLGESYRYENHLNFYRDAMFFMSRIRESHQALDRFEKAAKQRNEVSTKTVKELGFESEYTRHISTESFLRKQPVKVVMVDWIPFIFTKRDIKDSISAPIEVISGEPEPQDMIQLATTLISPKSLKSHGSRQVERLAPSGTGAESLEEKPLPERIKIHSSPLLQIFRQTFIGSPVVGSAKDGSVVFLRPYQELLYHENKLRHRLAALEKYFEHYDGSASSLPLPPDILDGTDGVDVGVSIQSRDPAFPSFNQQMVKEKESEITNERDENIASNEQDEDMRQPVSSSTPQTITTLLHLRCLLHFMDTEIAPKRAHITSQNCIRIHFHDLWFLFKPGDQVIDKQEKQVYVVLRVQNPRHKIEEPWDRWNSRSVDSSDSESDSEGEKDEDENPFTLLCAYIDFDGKAFGPITRKFKISPFGELRPI
ncbi:hypothetical protein CLIM01_11358 [Colletotrichum limetticola]|uniref:DUF7025 domain-containing protein n=1 Tax=Colletotrichum limetticola TaxID=1209924 RepID=A0ABQ9PJB3_9PEZI|nr:hypothetical protein CLIM01_11358 [Colletotrichum limetticola]